MPLLGAYTDNMPERTITQWSGLVKFSYEGVQRVVKDPVMKETGPGNIIIVGHELLRGEEATGTPKSYRIDRIGEPIEEVAI